MADVKSAKSVPADVSLGHDCIWTAGGIVDMKPRKYKLQFPDTVHIDEQVPETDWPLHITPGAQPNHVSRAGDTPRLTGLMLMLQKLLGTTLGGIAMGIQVGNVLICVSALLFGPAVILGLLPE